MTIYEIGADSLNALNQTSFSQAGLKERHDLQRLLRDQIDILGEEILIISEEFGEWTDSRRRIDLLGIDKDANVVVIELKRTEDGGFMDLQAVRYAAMVSTLTAQQCIDIYSRYLESRGTDVDAEQSLLDFLEWSDLDENNFAQDVRIVLAAADFSRELTTAVMWLLQKEVDIRCVRIKPYSHAGKTLIDVQQIIPLPEAEEYQIRVQEKVKREKIAREEAGRDYTKFNVSVNGDSHPVQNKNKSAFLVIKGMCDAGVDPEKIRAAMPLRRLLWKTAPGHLKAQEFADFHSAKSRSGRFDSRRWYCSDDELIYFNGSTYSLSRQWGRNTASDLLKLVKLFPETGVTCEIAKNGTEE